MKEPFRGGVCSHPSFGVGASASVAWYKGPMVSVRDGVSGGAHALGLQLLSWVLTFQLADGKVER